MVGNWIYLFTASNVEEIAWPATLQSSNIDVINEDSWEAMILGDQKVRAKFSAESRNEV